ncbi:MAG: NUDIX domain-containing protein [Candidatus Sungbacteria bacterium]|uniref:NUDIX domain-containing protein n=1 Tax=Candidatus Sungiibacteriota bacterium TaxID=2750080 RepID=A0A932VQR1_9BACT|nr:NUDIX domain-containing protein [Candidatus Sungbacteria bacterium]
MPHIHEKVDFTVEVFVVYRDRVLLRKHDKYKIWLSVGGHIEPDEDPTEAAVREVKEEVGLDVTLADDLLQVRCQTRTYQELIPPKFLNRHRINDTHEHVTLTYFALSGTDAIKEPEDREISDDCKWFTETELDDPAYEIDEHIAFYAHRALVQLGRKAFA